MGAVGETLNWFSILEINGSLSLLIHWCSSQIVMSVVRMMARFETF